MELEQGISRSEGNLLIATTRRSQTRVAEAMRYPCFYKIVTPSMAQDAIPADCKMVLPSAFVRTYLANIDGPQTMVLRSPISGWEWQVTYTNQSFEEGWRLFSMDYDLGSGDMVTFQLEDDFRFTVQVYSKFGCEKFSSFDVAACNTWASQMHRNYSAITLHRATAMVEGATHPEPVITRMRPNISFLRNMNDHKPEEIFEAIRTVSACNSGGSQDIDKRSLPTQTLNIGGKVRRALQEMHRKRKRVDSALLRVPVDAESGSFGKDFNNQIAVHGMTSKRDDHHVKEKQASHFIWRQTSASQMLAKGFIMKAKMRTVGLRVRVKPKDIFLKYKERLKKANFFPRITPASTEESADNTNTTTHESASQAQGSYRKEFIEYVKTARISELEDKRNLDTSCQTLNPCAGGTSKREYETSFEMKPDVTKINVANWESNVNIQKRSENQHQEVAGTPAKRGRGRPRKQTLQQPALKPEVLIPGFRRVESETTPIQQVEKPEREATAVEEVEKPAKRKRGRPRVHYKPNWRQETTSVQKERVIFVSQRRPVTESEKDATVAAAYSAAARMQTVCIILVMKPSSVYKNFVLRFPAKFASQRMPQITKDIRVCDSEWKSWSCSWNPSYHHISGREWRSFALEHCLEEEDACVFEILKHTQNMFTMMVHIFRVINIPAGKTAWESHICPKNCFPENTSCPITPIEPKSILDSEPLPPDSLRKITRSHQDNKEKEV